MVNQNTKAQVQIQREDLGMELVDGMPLRHGRETTNIPVGLFGNKAPYTITMVYWFS